MIILNKLPIEFVKNYELEYNGPSNYESVPNSNGTYLSVEFAHKVPVGYMKIKNKDLWLHEENGVLFFDRIKDDKYGFGKRQPLVLWFDYLVYGGMRVYKFTGSGIEGVIDKQYKSLKNMAYLHYNDNKIRWANSISEATIFIYDAVQWHEFVIKPYLPYNLSFH